LKATTIEATIMYHKKLPLQVAELETGSD